MFAHPHIPTYPLAAFREAHPSGQIRCGSCGASVQYDPSKTVELFLKKMPAALKRRWGTDTAITVSLAHDYFPYEFDPAADTRDGEQPATLHTLVYEDGVREEWVRTAEGHLERLYGIVYRDAAQPELVYREVWYPTGAFRAANEAGDAKT